MGQDEGGDDRKNRSKQMIEENLKKMYQADMAEDIPDRFSRLLDKLRQSESGGSNDAPRNGVNGGGHDD